MYVFVTMEVIKNKILHQVESQICAVDWKYVLAIFGIL